MSVSQLHTVLLLIFHRSLKIYLTSTDVDSAIMMAMLPTYHDIENRFRYGPRPHINQAREIRDAVKTGIPFQHYKTRATAASTASMDNCARYLQSRLTRAVETQVIKAFDEICIPIKLSPEETEVREEIHQSVQLALQELNGPIQQLFAASCLGPDASAGIKRERGSSDGLDF